MCEILTPDRERVREWLLPSHSRFLNPESGVTIITALTLRISHSRFSLPILKVTPETAPETAPDPEFSGSGVRNRDWLFKFSNPLPIFWKSLPKRLPKRLPIPIGSQNFGIGSENRDLLSQHVYVLSHLLQKPLPILTPDPDPDFFVESHSRFCQKIGSDPKMKFRTLIRNAKLCSESFWLPSWQ